MIRAAVAALVLIGAPGVQAASWGEHGLFQVEDGETAQERMYCQLKAEATIDGTAFSLVLRWFPPGRLQAFFMNGEELVLKAETVSVSVDGTRMLQFVPVRRDWSEGLSTVSSRTMGRVVGLAVQAMLEHAAEGAEWFQVTALPYEDAIPAQGLKEAMGDLSTCLRSKPL